MTDMTDEQLAELTPEEIEAQLWETVGKLRDSVSKSQMELRAVVAKICGHHEPKQHRDSQPPWCNLCGRDIDGQLRRKGPHYREKTKA